MIEEAERFALLLGLSLFFGFAFEQFFAEDRPRRPGGVRTFPMLALAGGALYLLEPHYGAACIGGLLIVGSWVYAYVRAKLRTQQPDDEGPLIVPVCIVLAYVLGPITLTQPLWVSVGLAVAAVLLLGGQRTLHDWAHRVSGQEITTAAQFLILIGVGLPLLAGQPVIAHTSIKPFGVWLAVVAVSTISYVSYLVQRYVVRNGGTVVMAVLGGLYSSTATTVVLSRRAHEEGMTSEIEAGIIVATAMMYPRILVVCALFNLALAQRLVLPLLILAAIAAAVAWLRARTAKPTVEKSEPANPLQIGTALIFAALFVAISLLTTAAQSHLGAAGIYWLAAVVGVTDIDPFVLSLAQSGSQVTGLATAASAVIIAASSNNVLKAIYAVAFSRRREALLPAGILGALAAAGVVLAFVLPR